MAINAHDHISFPQTRLRCRTIRQRAHNERTMIDRQIVPCRKCRIIVNRTDTQGCSPGMRDLACLNDLWHDELYTVGWNRESYTVRRSIKLRIDGSECRNTHQVALQVHQRPTTVARVNRRVGLDCVRDDSSTWPFGDGTSQGTDD